MNIRLLLIISILATSFMVACTTPKQVVSTTPEATFWYKNNTVIHSVSSDEDITDYSCNQINKSEKGDDIFTFESKWKTHCGKVNGYDFEEGKIYQVRAYHTLAVLSDGTDASSYEVIEVLQIERDPFYRKKEFIIGWIGPKTVEGPCNYIHAPPGCVEDYHQIQYGEKLDKNGEWKKSFHIMPGYHIKDYQEGNVYQIQYTVEHFSDVDPKSSDEINYKIKDFKVLKSEKF